MTPTEQSAQKPSHRMGLFATLRAAVFAIGTGAPKPSRLRPLALVAALLCLLAFSAPANAAQTRVLQRTYGCAASAEHCDVPDPAPLSNPQGIAVNADASSASLGDVYVADTGNDRVEKFGPGGEFLLTFGKEVGPLGEDTCTLSCKPGTKASTPGAFEHAQFLAIDQTTGDVYVADTADNKVSKFSPEGVLETTWGTGGQVSNGSPTLGTGALTEGSQRIEAVTTTSGEFAVGQELTGEGLATGTTITELPEPGVIEIGKPAGKTMTVSLTAVSAIAGIAVGATGTLYVMSTENPNRVLEFESNGKSLSEVQLKRFAFRDGLVVNAEGDLFKADGGAQIAEYGAAGGAQVRGLTPEGVVEGSPGVENPGALTGGPEGGIYFTGVNDTLEHYELNAGGEVVEPGGGECKEECAPTDSSAVGFVPSGIGVAANGDPLLLNAKEGEVGEYGPFVTVPNATTQAASERGPRSVTFNGIVNPEGLPVTECVFEYGTSTAYGQKAPCEEPDAAEIVSEEPVHAKVEGLTPGVTYHFRLLARNASDPSPLTVPNPGADLSVETLPPPSIDSATVTGLSATAAVLNASIDPHEAVTEYHFEYDTRPYASGEAAHGTQFEGQLAAVEKDEAVHEAIAELLANRTYYWRVVASNASGVTTGVGHSFVYATEEGAGLPDGRAYEMVSPDRKNGALLGDVSGLGLPTDVAADGQRVITSVIQCFAGAAGCNAQQDDGIGSPYEFTRTSGGWVTTALSPPASALTPNAAFGYSAQAGTALFGVPTGPSDEDDLYVREPSGKFVDVGPDTPPEDGAQGPHGGVMTAHEQAQTADFSHFAWDADYLWSSPFVEASGSSIHEVFEVAPGTAAKNRPLDVGVSGGYEDGGNHNLISDCGTNLGEARENGAAPGGTMSADGQTVYFTALPEVSGAPCPSGADGEVPVAEVFARVAGETAVAHTVAISEPSPSACGSGAGAAEVACRTAPAANAQFIAGSEDGSDALFTSTQQLTDGASEDSNPGDSAAIDNTGNGCAATTGANGCSLYLFEGVRAEHASERRLVDVSEGEGVVAGGPRVQGVLAVSPGSAGEHVYFVAKGVLTPRERPGCTAEWAAAGRGGEAACHAVEGAENLYVYSQEAHSLGFVAAMSASDLSEWAQEEAGLPANVTPDGRFLVFLSRADLTVDDTSRAGAYQVFRYDAVTGGLLRLSAGGGGFNDDGNRSSASVCTLGAVGVVCSEDANVVRGKGASRRDPSMSDSGSRVFFESPVALTTHALDDVQIAGTTELLGNSENMPIYAENVYEWESGGVGACPADRVSGCVFLISDGRDVGLTRGPGPGCSAGSAVCLLGSDASGDNVFLATTDALVASDTNTELDYYDAKVCEAASPCVEASASVAGCAGEECHGLPSGSPGVPSVPSASFNGSGNVTPPPAVKPVVLTRAEKLGKALKACHAKANKHKRVACEAVARKRYGPPHKAKKAAKAKRSASRRGGR